MVHSVLLAGLLLLPAAVIACGTVPHNACIGLSTGDSCCFPGQNNVQITDCCKSNGICGNPPGQGTACSSDSDNTDDSSGSSVTVCALLGDVGRTTATGTDARTNNYFAANENIYGPFEAGFTSQQDNNLASLGCTTGRGYVAGGIDTWTAEQVVAHDCSVTLPRIVGGTYVSLIDECGGHTGEYHFHERLSCLYNEEGEHSTQVGVGQDGKLLYGKWENYNDGVKPLLDACGGHFGITPDSNGVVVYHYHVQQFAPFTFGCFGPDVDADENDILVTLEKCRSIYTGCGDGDTTTLTTSSGSFSYDPWCPCFDANGSNIGTAQLAVFANAPSSTPTSSSPSTPTSHPSSSPSSTPTSHPSSHPSSSPSSTPTSHPSSSPSSAATRPLTLLGPSPVPSAGGPAGCWLQILQVPVSSKYCAHNLKLHLNYGANNAPAAAYEVRAYSIEGATATLSAVQSVVVDVSNQDEQSVSISPCLPLEAGEYIALANREGSTKVTVASGSQYSYTYYNRFSESSSVVGDDIELSSTFGLGELGWNVDGNLVTNAPDSSPSSAPSSHPSSTPSSHPSSAPSSHPSSTPSSHPSSAPSSHPSSSPLSQPSSSPTEIRIENCSGLNTVFEEQFECCGNPHKELGRSIVNGASNAIYNVAKCKDLKAIYRSHHCCQANDKWLNMTLF